MYGYGVTDNPSAIDIALINVKLQYDTPYIQTVAYPADFCLSY